jgi:hypothetical protein
MPTTPSRWWPAAAGGEILRRRVAGRLRLRPADAHPRAGRQRGRTRRRAEEPHSHRALAAAQMRERCCARPGPGIRDAAPIRLLPAPRHAASAGAAAAVAVRAPALVPAQVPVLRLQQPPSAGGADLPEARYLDALRGRPGSRAAAGLGPARAACSSAAARPACSRPAGIDRLLADIRARLPLEPGCEITLEANPGTFERERFRAFRAAGVTRLSIGVQSFDDAMLQAHRPRARRRAGARRGRRGRAAFDTFNIDLMYALPGQTLAAAAAPTWTRRWPSAAAPVDLPPDGRAQHGLRQARPGLPDDDLASDMLDLITSARRRTAWPALRGVGLRAAGPPLRAQPELLAVRRLPGHRRRGARQAELSRTASCARCAGASRAAYMEHALAGRAVSQRARGGDAQATCRSSSCSTRCACRRLRPGRFLPRRTGLPQSTVPAAGKRAQAKGLIVRGTRVAHRARLRLPERPAALFLPPAGAGPLRLLRRGVMAPAVARSRSISAGAICVPAAALRWRRRGDGLARHAEHHAAGLVLAPGCRLPASRMALHRAARRRRPCR